MIADELRRMRLARSQRGDTRALAVAVAARPRAGIGALAVRTFERGERVHVAMLARGYDGRMPVAAARARGVAARLGRRGRSCPPCAVAVLVVARAWV